MILCDTGPLVAASIKSEASHHSCVKLFTGLRLARRRLLLPATVTTEVGYLLDKLAGPAYEAAFLRSASDGDFELVDREAAFGRQLGRLRRLGRISWRV